MQLASKSGFGLLEPLMTLPRYIAPLIAIASLGSVHFVEKLAIHQGASPGPFALGQTAVAMLVLAPIWLWRVRHENSKSAQRAPLVPLAIIGIVASGIVVLLAIMALSYTSATHKGVIQASYPLGTMFFAWVLLRERITAIGYMAAVVIVAGLVLMTSRGFGSAPNLGDWILIATVPLMGFSDAFSKKVLRHVSPLTVSFGRYFFGTAFLAILLSVLDLGDLNDLLPVWQLVLAAGMMTALAMQLFYWSVDRIGPSIAAGMLAAAPVVTAALEWRWLDESFLQIQLLGMAMVVVGVTTLSRQKTTDGG
jgi:drug/metabolite transporter (DMT)-like permease